MKTVQSNRTSHFILNSFGLIASLVALAVVVVHPVVHSLYHEHADCPLCITGTTAESPPTAAAVRSVDPPPDRLVPVRRDATLRIVRHSKLPSPPRGPPATS